MFTAAHATVEAAQAPRPQTFATRLLGVLLGAMMLCLMVFSAVIMVVQDAWAFWFQLAAAVFLVICARKNSPVLARGFGKVMRRLVGETGTRVYFALGGVALVLGALFGAATRMVP